MRRVSLRGGRFVLHGCKRGDQEIKINQRSIKGVTRSKRERFPADQGNPPADQVCGELLNTVSNQVP